MATKEEQRTVEATAVYEQDSKRFHRYRILEGAGGVTGSLYIPREGNVPGKVLISLQVKGGGEQ